MACGHIISQKNLIYCDASKNAQSVDITLRIEIVYRTIAAKVLLIDELQATNGILYIAM